MASATGTVTAHKIQGVNRLIVGIVLAVITFWLFAQTTLNVAPTMREELGISESLNNIAVTITALFSGIFIVVASGIADRLGRLKMITISTLNNNAKAAANQCKRCGHDTGSRQSLNNASRHQTEKRRCRWERLRSAVNLGYSGPGRCR